METGIAYYRVSTAKQGDSGLGLEAQQHQVESFAASRDINIIEPPYIEVETGTAKKHRPVLQQAIAAAQANDAILLIAKLDRLARNVHFISGLMQSGVKFVAVDLPNIDNFSIHILAAVAEQEAELISTRTRAGLAAAKRRGVKLGKPENMSHAAQIKGARVKQDQAIADYKPLTGYIKTMRYDLNMSLPKIAARLEEEGHRTRTGKKFHPNTVKRILDRAKETN